MNILMTGGSGDLACISAPLLKAQGYTPLRLDISPPKESTGIFIEGSILDRKFLADVFHHDTACVVHIAAWHGIHEASNQKTPEEFWDLNVTGTFNVCEAATKAGIRNLVYISSTSYDDGSFYGMTKVLGEEIVSSYHDRLGLNVIILRPRAFIPHWNKATYNSYIEWAHWFWKGAVHISDVARAVVSSVNILKQQPPAKHPVLIIDGAYEYSDEDFANWDDAGEGATFNRVYPGYIEMVQQYGLDPAMRPNRLGSEQAQRLIGYVPEFSLKTLLDELATFGASGPPRPF